MDTFGIIHVALLFVLSIYSTAASVPEPVAPAADDVTVDQVTWPAYDNVRLPDSLKPYLYNITLWPYFYDGLEDDTFPFESKTVIYINCIKDTDIIRLHISRHVVQKITIGYTDDDGTYQETHPSKYRENENEMMEIQAGITLKAGGKFTLTIESSSTITNLLYGLYWSPYKENGETKYIITTMMEPTCARLVFPCFDEPDFKAVFLLNIYRRAEVSCISNLPRRFTRGPDEEGLYVDVFDQPRNVPMSTYLVAFACGDISYLETHVDDKIQFRTYSRRSVVNHTAFALDIGVKTLKFFQDYFSVPYPLPKQDMIAVPTMSFNAMEHWGMITYREEAMLFEPGVNSEADKEWTAILTAHEISHQWFGNIVSPHWWDDLWLNEGFATYMMFLATDSILPEWNMMNVQVLDFRGIQNVFSVDDKLSSHPVYIPVSHPNEINEIFDLISYAKGSAVIRMMNFFLGEKTFKDGLTRYLNEYSFKTATHDDLWRSLQEQATEDNCSGTDVKLVMDTWLLEKNYPVVMVTRLPGTTLHLSQTAFLIDADERKERADISWEIPVTYTTDGELNFDQTAEDITWLHKDKKDVNVTDETLTNAAWVLANIHQYGYYRVNYDVANWNALIYQLNKDPFVIHPINRAQIIDDAWNLAKASLLDFEIAIQTIDYIDTETNYVPWKAALRQLKTVRNALQLTPLYGMFEDFMKQKLKSAFFKIKYADSHHDIIKYSMLAGQACRYGIKACVDDATEIFNQWMHDASKRLDPNIKRMVFCQGVAHGGRAAWEHVLHVYTSTDSPGEKMSLLAALACTKEPWILAKLLDLTAHGNVFSQNDRITAVAYVAGNPVGRLMTWNYLEETWDRNFDLYGTTLNLFPEMVKAITAPFNTEAELTRVKNFMKSKPDLGTAKRQFEMSLVDIQANIDWIQTHYNSIETWLQAQVV